VSGEHPKISIVAPAYNEEANIERSVRSWEHLISSTGISGEIVVTDDGSRDATKTILTSLSEEYDNLSVIVFERNRGYGKALASSIEMAKGDFVVTIDSDGQFNPDDIPVLIAKLKEGDYDLVTGFRRRKNDSVLRVVADRGLNLLVRLMFGVKLRDTNCALKVVKRECFHHFSIESSGYPTPTEITLKAHQLGYKLAEVGIDHLERSGGKSSLKLMTTAWSMFRVLIYFKYKFSLFRKGIIKAL
jgi:glycosyltransferase involved in cell wall biosynthesis